MRMYKQKIQQGASVSLEPIRAKEVNPVSPAPKKSNKLGQTAAVEWEEVPPSWLPNSWPP